MNLDIEDWNLITNSYVEQYAISKKMLKSVSNIFYLSPS